VTKSIVAQTVVVIPNNGKQQWGAGVWIKADSSR
jgi:hypothetical protein